MRIARLIVPAIIGLPAAGLPAALAAQGTPLKVAASGRAMTSVSFPGAQGTAPLTISIDYGVPHSRGRPTPGTVDPYDKVWRFGANVSTTLKSDVDLTLGGKNVPKGSYSLFALPSKGGWMLIVNKQTGQPGTEYKPEMDLVRIPVRSQTLATPLESFTIWLIPSGDGSPKGELRFGWGTMAFSADWTAR
jgi:hypothetical protein